VAGCSKLSPCYKHCDGSGFLLTSESKETLREWVSREAYVGTKTPYVHFYSQLKTFLLRKHVYIISCCNQPSPESIAIFTSLVFTVSCRKMQWMTPHLTNKKLRQRTMWWFAQTGSHGSSRGSTWTQPMWHAENCSESLTQRPTSLLCSAASRTNETKHASQFSYNLLMWGHGTMQPSFLLSELTCQRPTLTSYSSFSLVRVTGSPYHLERWCVLMVCFCTHSLKVFSPW
jgi:hypothetical protein